MTKAKQCDDFRTNHLEGDALKVAKIIKKVIGEDADGGGCRAFWTPEEWRERKEYYGLDSVLVLVHDGGDLAPFCNWDYGCYEMSERLRIALEKAGFFYEQCTCWHSAVYRIEKYGKAEEKEEAKKTIEVSPFNSALTIVFRNESQSGKLNVWVCVDRDAYDRALDRLKAMDHVTIVVSGASHVEGL